jgi:dTDP-glucose 4,6-dehydratase
MNLLVTGGCGFIGGHFIRRLLPDPAAPLRRLVNLDALTYAADPASLAGLPMDPRYTFVHGDILDRGLLDGLFAANDFDAVVHFAAETHVDRSIDGPAVFVQTNILGTHQLLEASQAHFARLPADRRATFRFLHVSTDEVYGSLGPSKPPFTEQSPFAPNSPYAASKASSDLLVRAACQTHGLPVLTTRCSNNYGSHQFPEKLLPLMLLNALEDKPLPIYGDGRQIRDWLHVEDHVEALWNILCRATPGAVYNIGSESERTNLNLVHALCAILDNLAPRTDGRPYAGQITHVADRPGHDRRYALDCSRLRADLGWTPRHHFESGLTETVAWYLANRPWCDAITIHRYARERLGNRA